MALSFAKSPCHANTHSALHTTTACCPWWPLWDAEGVRYGAEAGRLQPLPQLECERGPVSPDDDIQRHWLRRVRRDFRLRSTMRGLESRRLFCVIGFGTVSHVTLPCAPTSVALSGTKPVLEILPPNESLAQRTEVAPIERCLL